MEIDFKFKIGSFVYLYEAEDEAYNFIRASPRPKYKIISKLYEEISEGVGLKSYVVRHIDNTAPGGGKMYKLSEDDIVSSDVLNTLQTLRKQMPQPQISYEVSSLTGTVT